MIISNIVYNRLLWWQQNSADCYMDDTVIEVTNPTWHAQEGQRHPETHEKVSTILSKTRLTYDLMNDDQKTILLNIQHPDMITSHRYVTIASEDTADSWSMMM